MPEATEAYQENLEALVSTRTEQLRQSMSDLEHAQDCIIEAYGDALQLKHPATAAHSRRLVPFSIALGRVMQLNALEIHLIARAAFLHDVGKLAIPDAVLAKGSLLTDDEQQTLQRHCVWGYEIVTKIRFLSPVAKLIVAHHENWDGTGYPHGLKAESIPIGARMIAVLNAFDNMSYRQAQSFEVAVQEITSAAGTRFDPQIVEAFLRVPQSTWREIGKEAEVFHGLSLSQQ